MLAYTEPVSERIIIIIIIIITILTRIVFLYFWVDYKWFKRGKLNLCYWDFISEDCISFFRRHNGRRWAHCSHIEYILGQNKPFWVHLGCFKGLNTTQYVLILVYITPSVCLGVILSLSVHNLGQLDISPSEDLVLGISEVITLDASKWHFLGFAGFLRHL